MFRVCSIEGCSTRIQTRGWCARHYRSWYRHGDPLASRPAPLVGQNPHDNLARPCSVAKCKRGHYAKGFCNLHWKRWRKHGDPLDGEAQEAHQPTKNKDGYILVWAPEHPMAYAGRRAPEHRLIMEKMLGRYLFPDENVHHRNGKKGDNRPENLELWLTHQPKGQRVSEVLQWAMEIVQRYHGSQLALLGIDTATDDSMNPPDHSVTT